MTTHKKNIPERLKIREVVTDFLLLFLDCATAARKHYSLFVDCARIISIRDLISFVFSIGESYNRSCRVFALLPIAVSVMF